MEKFTDTHEWFETADGKFGISSFAIAQLGDVVFVDLPEVGKVFKKGDEIAVVESVKAASEIYAPISGKVIEINHDLKANPASLTPVNWKSSWFAVIEPSDKSEFEGLKNKEDYEKMVG